MNYLVQVLLTVYLGLAPIYWLPGVSPFMLGGFKIILFILTFLTILLLAAQQNKLRFPTGILGPLGLILSLLSITASLLRADLSFAMSAIKDYTLVFSTLWVFFILSRMKIPTEAIFTGSAYIVASACLVVALSRYTGIVDFKGPKEFVADHLWISGFSSLRTGWSNGVALYVAPLALSLMPGKKQNIIWPILATIATSAIILSQFAVAGRAGLLASVLIMVAAFSVRKRRIFLTFGLIALTCFVIANREMVYSQMRISRDTGVSNNADDLNTISAGRLGGALKGLDLAMESPLIGNGFGEVILGKDEIHNLWIRLAAESGFFAPIILGLITLRILHASISININRHISTQEKNKSRIYIGALTGGIFISMLEPRMLLGTFQISVMWWAIAGTTIYQVLIKRKPLNRNPSNISGHRAMMTYD